MGLQPGPSLIRKMLFLPVKPGLTPVLGDRCSLGQDWSIHTHAGAVSMGGAGASALSTVAAGPLHPLYKLCRTPETVFTGLRRSPLPCPAVGWMDLEGVTLGEVSQKEADTLRSPHGGPKTKKQKSSHSTGAAVVGNWGEWVKGGQRYRLAGRKSERWGCTAWLGDTTSRICESCWTQVLKGSVQTVL